MRAPRSLTIFALLAATAAGCAAISGLDKLEKVECTDDCEAGAGDASHDVTVGDGQPDGPGADVTTDTTGDAGDAGDAVTFDGGDAGDSSIDARDADADAPADAPNDAPDADASDAPVDTGCGATNTITNCGACGNACNQTNNTNRTCNGTSCGYTCIAGRSDCNAATAPDLDGCECATPGCCAGSTCQSTHQNGVGQSFYDCVAVGTYNQPQAMEACVAFTGNAGQCTNAGCLAPDGGPSGNVVCSSGSPTSCVCWQYDALFAGHLFNSGMAGLGNCFCPGGGNPSWN